MKSMTAFAKHSFENENILLEIEIKTYNSKWLDFYPFISSPYNALKDRFQRIVSQRIKRGKVDLKFSLRKKEEIAEFILDNSKLETYKKAMNVINEALGIKTSVSFEYLLKNSTISDQEEINNNFENDWELIEKVLNETIDKLLIMRETEGEFLYNDFLKRLNFIEELLKNIYEQSFDLVKIYQAKLKERIQKLVEIEINENKLLEELAFYADRSDITEELTRLASHIKQFKKIMDEEDAGRRLNFLVQEMHREANTIASKSNSDKISHLSVDLRSELDKLKEQIQNIE